MSGNPAYNPWYGVNLTGFGANPAETNNSSNQQSRQAQPEQQSHTENPFAVNSGVRFDGFESPRQTVARNNASRGRHQDGANPGRGHGPPAFNLSNYPPDHPSHPGNRGGQRGRGGPPTRGGPARGRGHPSRGGPGQQSRRGSSGRGGPSDRGGRLPTRFEQEMGWREGRRPTKDYTPRENVDHTALDNVIDSLRDNPEQSFLRPDGSMTLSREWARRMLGADMFVHEPAGGPWLLRRDTALFAEGVSQGFPKPLLDWLAGVTEPSGTYAMSKDVADFFFKRRMVAPANSAVGGGGAN
ncbi:hypothetical protein P280DRAFT_538208 [Massarina eburnea CBS 473.64]|uniref:Uncharacterized protein n=1 Tax=Massarina eburnea CBS 473.64 TaxID=1395130 RepID=A0A6A6SBY2_9PLEO|nr:hypothetical protein P280DRAFT_538208 [Massarina eburnea CBS 473.64]